MRRGIAEASDQNYLSAEAWHHIGIASHRKELLSSSGPLLPTAAMSTNQIFFVTLELETHSMSSQDLEEHDRDLHLRHTIDEIGPLSSFYGPQSALHWDLQMRRVYEDSYLLCYCNRI